MFLEPEGGEEVLAEDILEPASLYSKRAAM
jgi:hypothetical protein